MANRKRDSEGKFASKGMMGPMKDNPWTSAAIAAGAAGIGAFLWSKRNQLGEAFDSGMDRLSELKAERMGGGRSQEEFSEEALTLKETGRKSKGPRGPLAQQDIKAGIATSNQEAKAGAKAYS
ncbi:MAG TPA: hypothetical protein VM326_04235 [Sphingomicrobium sp.]|jgi:hypothetical protein|nr:hypothetical protein [Sphingomicrobium sp.]